jgi:hypothetical protein
MTSYFRQQIEQLLGQSNWLLAQYHNERNHLQCGFINSDEQLLFALSDTSDIVLEGFINKKDASWHFTEGTLLEQFKLTHFNSTEQAQRLTEYLEISFSSMTLEKQVEL